jgi:hypothetical protein
VGQKAVTLGSIEPPLQTLLKYWTKPAVVGDGGLDQSGLTQPR